VNQPKRIQLLLAGITLVGDIRAARSGAKGKGLPGIGITLGAEGVKKRLLSCCGVAASRCACSLALRANSAAPAHRALHQAQNPLF